MIPEDYRKKVLEIIGKYGIKDQLNMLTEECGELIVAINHFRRNRIEYEKLVSELVDVKILVDQFLFLSDQVLVKDLTEIKIKRTLDES